MTADSLRAMLKQEASGRYNCLDYLSMTPWHQEVYQVNKKNSPVRNEGAVETRIDEYCREQIVEWSFRVVDYFRIDREVVSLSISFLDRFLSKCRCDRTSFKLAATTTLNLAVKLLYPCKLGELGILSDLSRGEFDMADVADMENCILRALSWRLHPPTPVAFATLLLDYVSYDAPLEISSADLDDVYDVSSFFCDLAVCDYFFVPLKPSTIAVAAIQNALEGMFGPKNRLDHDILRAARKLSIYSSQDLSAARNRLWELYERSEECALHNKVTAHQQDPSWNGGIFVKKMTTTSSPVSISTSCTTSTRPEISYTKHQMVHNNTSW
jgi:Cyclin, N-terminal domain/Cyclin, C-terminal domain